MQHSEGLREEKGRLEGGAVVENMARNFRICDVTSLQILHLADRRVSKLDSGDTITITITRADGDACAPLPAAAHAQRVGRPASRCRLRKRHGRETAQGSAGRR